MLPQLPDIGVWICVTENSKKNGEWNGLGIKNKRERNETENEKESGN